jgi:hypothetical protein
VTQEKRSPVHSPLKSFADVFMSFSYSGFSGRMFTGS